MSDLKQTFEKEMAKDLAKKLGLTNTMAVPKLTKIVVNSSTKEFLSDKKDMEKAAEDLAVITGQKPKVTRAKVSVASFKLRQGEEIGLVVTLRGRRMYDFFEKLVKVILPRVRDFSGIDKNAFDGKGNITLGFSEHTSFPEIDSGKVDRIRSLQLVIVTNAKRNERARVLLEALGMPFKKEILSRQGVQNG